MLKRIFCFLLCVLLLSGCSENYDTVVTDGGSGTKKPITQEQTDGTSENNNIGNDNPQNNNSSYNDIPMNDIGKDYKLYDNKSVVDAYLSGDDSGLSKSEKEIYNEAKRILDDIKSKADSDYEIELLIHDYIITTATYDSQAISVVENPQENSENPYGILINKTGICLGYTTTFQLFMDMAEIPCVTIYAQDRSYHEHAWNQVMIDGKWYYVDCTWDDPVPDYEGRGAYHTYFNITEEMMWDTGHRWDKDMCEESDSYESSYILKTSETVSSEKEIVKALEKADDAGSVDAYVRINGYNNYQNMVRAAGKIFSVYDELKIDGNKYVYYQSY